jgi:hypothetical protein
MLNKTRFPSASTEWAMSAASDQFLNMVGFFKHVSVRVASAFGFNDFHPDRSAVEAQSACHAVRLTVEQ